MDIDLEDPDVEKAAIKIQAGFKGMMARKEVKEKKGDQEGAGAEETAAAPAEDSQVGICILDVGGGWGWG